MTPDSTPTSVPRLCFSGPLVIQTVAKWREDIVASIPVSGPLVLDLAAVETCDTFGAQLLISIGKATEECGIDVRWTNVSDGLRSHLRSFGWECPLPDDVSSRL